MNPLDRAWSRRPLVSAPHWGRSAPPGWLESSVTFSRSAPLAGDGRGGFTAGGEGPTWTTVAHVEVVSGDAGAGDVVMGLPLKRQLEVILNFPGPGDPMPAKGDSMDWTSDTGVKYHTSVRLVTSPLTIHDHLEIVSELFD